MQRVITSTVCHMSTWEVRLCIGVARPIESAVAGSATVGDAAILAGQTGVSDHVHLAPGVVLSARAAASAASKLSTW